MNSLKRLHMYVVDCNPHIVKTLRERFRESDYTIDFICSGIEYFADCYPTVEAYVSPGNSFGLMDGGYDKSLSNVVGHRTTQVLRNNILQLFGGEQPPGTCLMIPFEHKYLLHTPTMRRPSAIKDPMVVYYCMRSAIRMCLSHNIRSVAIPAFGAGTGKLDPRIVADMMFHAVESLRHRYPQQGCCDWNSIYKFEDQLPCNLSTSTLTINSEENPNPSDILNKQYAPPNIDKNRPALDIHTETVKQFKLRVFGEV